MSLREEFVLLASREGTKMSELCGRFGVSRKKGHKWRTNDNGRNCGPWWRRRADSISGVETYNNERPHEALDLGVPVSRHRVSPPSFEERLELVVGKILPGGRVVCNCSMSTARSRFTSAIRMRV